MPLRHLTSINRHNRHRLLLLIGVHALWGVGAAALSYTARLFDSHTPGWSAAFLLVQLLAATQLLIPLLQLQEEERSRGFYLFWGIVLGVGIWLANLAPVPQLLTPLADALKSALLLLTAALVGATLARYVNRLWEILPLALAMALADFLSWFAGPTANFAQQIETWYREPIGPPPAIDMVLVKMAFPGSANLLPVFGISDWIMVVFFACVAQRFQINNNLLRLKSTANNRVPYLPLSAAALLAVILFAQLSGHFIPALPLIAAIILCGYGLRWLLLKSAGKS
ncbi:MAG: hypothetical protein C0622_08300 [Desulfuromonas sp.]|nr:MAG: hypothetical protein C0622_08300 [Desulfuromonas sp.]